MKINKFLSKLVTLGLSIVMLSSSIPTNVHAAEEDGLVPVDGLEGVYYADEATRAFYEGTSTPTPAILPTQTRGQLNVDGTQKKKLVQIYWDVDGGDKNVVKLDVPDEYQLYYEPDLYFCSPVIGSKYGYMSTAWQLSAYDASGTLISNLNPFGLFIRDYRVPGICTYKEYGSWKKLFYSEDIPVTNLGQNKYIRNDELGLFGFTSDGVFYFDQENLGDPQLFYYNEQGQFVKAVDTKFPDLQLNFYRNELGQVVDCADGAMGERGGGIIDYYPDGYIYHIYSYGRSGVTGGSPKANYLNNEKVTLIWE